MVGFLEKRRQKKIRDLASQQGDIADTLERERKAREYHKRNRMSDLRKVIPAAVMTILAFAVSYETLNSAVGEVVSLSITVPSMALIYFVMWGMISRTYSPPYDKFFVTGHVDPDNLDSAIFFQKWLIPKKITGTYLVEGVQFSVMTTEGLMFFCERLDFDWDTGDLTVKFGWPGLDEFNFLLDHGVFHNMQEIIPLLFKKIQNIEANLEVLVHLRAEDMEKDHFKRILHALLDITRAKSNSDLERYREEIEKTNSEIDIRLKPRKVNDVEMKSGGKPDE
ncbi:MAG: hypothetical protein ACYCT2_04465 [Thermoplasmataceae archaeon]